MKSAIFLTLVVILSIPSCKKAYNLTEKEKLLISHGWNYSSLRINGVEMGVMPWNTDDCLVFRPDGTCAYYGGTIRSPSHEVDRKELWYLSDDEKTMNFECCGDPIIQQRIDISENELILTTIFEGEIREFIYTPC